MSRNADQIAYWNEVAGAKWVRHQPVLDRLMAPLTERLLAVIAAQPGERFLDVGCGCGELAMRLSERAGSTGEVLAVDVSAPMLAHAAARAAGLPAAAAPIRWLEADAATQKFRPERDALVSRFGVMFFDDRASAFRNLRTALRPAGRFVFLAWRSRAAVEWMQAPLEWIAAVLPIPEDASDGEAGPFALADDASTIRILESAGFEHVAARPIECPLYLGASVEEAAVLLGHTGPAAAAMRDAGPHERAEAEALIRDRLMRHAVADGSVVLGGACWIYEGRVPELGR